MLPTVVLVLLMLCQRADLSKYLILLISCPYRCGSCIVLIICTVQYTHVCSFIFPQAQDPKLCQYVCYPGGGGYTLHFFILRYASHFVDGMQLFSFLPDTIETFFMSKTVAYKDILSCVYITQHIPSRISLSHSTNQQPGDDTCHTVVTFIRKYEPTNVIWAFLSCKKKRTSESNRSSRGCQSWKIHR